jgi:hypothetical protein
LEEKKKEDGRKKEEKSDSGRRYVIVGEAYNAGESVEALMKRYAVAAGTILDHLARYASAGNKLRNGDDLWALSSASPDEQKAAMQAFEELGTAFLKPVFDKLGGKIDYDELKILRLLFLSGR